MKKTIIILGVAILTAISSCSKKEVIMVESLSYPHLYVSVEESDTDPATKAFVKEFNGSYICSWKEGDYLSAYYGNSYNKKYVYIGATGVSGSFNPVNETEQLNPGVDITSGYNYVIYPYDTHNGCDPRYGDLLTVPYPRERTYSNPGGAGASIMLAGRSTTQRLTLNHIAGYLGFSLYGEGVSVASITLISNGGEAFSGVGYVQYDGSTPTVTFTNEEGKDEPMTTVLYDPAIELSASSDGAKMFWITLPPTVLSKGLTLIVKDVNGRKWEQSASTFPAIERNVFQPFDPMEVEIQTIPVTGVTLDKSSLSLRIGGSSEKLTATVTPSEASDQSVTWTSSDSSVASVDQEGNVTPGTQFGTATITVKTVDGEKTASCTVTVDKYTYGLAAKLADGTDYVLIGENNAKAFAVTLTTTVNDGTPQTSAVTNATISVPADNEFATITSEKKIQGLFAGGTVPVTVKFTPEGSSEELTASVDIYVAQEDPNHPGKPIVTWEGEEDF